MIKITSYGEVTRFDISRTLAGRGRYWTTAYHLGDTLIDSGCAHTANELRDALADLYVTRIVNTHSHEDHVKPLRPHGSLLRCSSKNWMVRVIAWLK